MAEKEGEDIEHLLLAKHGGMGRRRKYKVSDGK
jgi:hypothetical protein